jgi:hypothetical protein
LTGFDEGVARLPKWILGLGLVGTGAAGQFYGLAAALGFLLGAAGAYVNLRLIERFVDRLGQLALAEQKPARRTRGLWLFLQFLGLVTGAFVILRVSGLNIVAALCGFLVCPAAVLLEILYELLTYGHS